MTHFDGYMNGYQTAFSFYSCCNHDAGLELLRTFSGENWLFETKADYFMPCTNGRHTAIRVYFGDGGIGTTFVEFRRVRDGPFPCGTPETTPVAVRLAQKLVPPPSHGGQPTSNLEIVSLSPNPSGDVYYFRLERAGSILTAMWSYDGVTWNTTFSRDMGTDLDGLSQRVAVTGLSWFVPAGSYIDYDYISVTPTVVPVDIDVKPGSDPNCFNNDGHGVIPVAILGSADFDVTQVDPATVQIEGLAVGARGKSNKLLAHIEDTNGDGFDDLVVQIEDVDGTFASGSGTATLTGNLWDGTPFEGSDEICVVP
jgi:hypothetical protein